MIKYKIDKNLVGSKNWPKIPSIYVAGIKGEHKITPAMSEEEKEKVIRTWPNVVVMRATSKELASFYLGFSNLGIISYMKHEFKTDMSFAMRVGPDPIRFFVLPLDLSKQIKLEKIDITNEDDPTYNDTILI